MNSFIENIKTLEDSFYFLIIRIMHGLIFSTLFYISTRVIDIIWGHSWRSYYSTIVIILILLIMIYPLIIKFKKQSFIFLIGWYSGIFIFNKFNLLDNSHLLIYFIVPTLIYLIKLILKK
jgi:hypothetical protein